MKFWNRVAVGMMALFFALSLGLGQSQATEKKSKKKKAEEKHEMMVAKRMASEAPIAGANLAGKPGYFFADTAEGLQKGQVMGAAHLSFNTSGSVLQIPVGVSYGIADKLMINVNTSFYTISGFSGLSFLNFGGKYSFGEIGHTKNLDLAAGLDFSVGPLSGAGGIFGFDPYGVITYTFSDGFQLNGKLGLYVLTADGYSASNFQFDLGAAYPFDKDLTGIAELATNGDVSAAGIGATPILVGIRTGHDVQLQAFAGLDLGVEAGFFVGGGLVLVSQ